MQIKRLGDALGGSPFAHMRSQFMIGYLHQILIERADQFQADSEGGNAAFATRKAESEGGQ